MVECQGKWLELQVSSALSNLHAVTLWSTGRWWHTYSRKISTLFGPKEKDLNLSIAIIKAKTLQKQEQL